MANLILHFIFVKIFGKVCDANLMGERVLIMMAGGISTHVSDCDSVQQG